MQARPDTADESAAVAAAQDRVGAFLHDLQRLHGSHPTAGRHLLVACSGGVDSQLMLALLASLPRPHRPALLTAAFCDHGLRPVRADRDAVHELARGLGVEVREARTQGLAGQGNPMARARAWRYRALDTIAHQVGADLACTGHHAGDQLESILHGLVTSGSIRGARGIEPWAAAGTIPGCSVPVLRPLLALTRPELEAAARELDLAWVEDPANGDLDRPRARLRENVIPDLEAINAAAGRNLARHARQLAEADAALSGLADALLGGGRSATRPPAEVDAAMLAALPAPAARALVAHWLRRHGLGRALSERTVDAVLRLTAGGDSGNNRSRPGIDLAAARIELAGDRLQLSPHPKEPGPA